MDESQILSAMSLVSEKLALCMAEGFSVKLDGIGTFNAKLGVRDDKLPDAFEEGETSRNAKSIMVNGVSYRADKELIRNTDRKCMLVRGGEKQRLRNCASWPVTPQPASQARGTEARRSTYCGNRIYCSHPTYIRAFCFSPAPEPRYFERASLNFQTRSMRNVRRAGLAVDSSRIP